MGGIIFWFELLIYLLNVHIILIRLLGGKLNIKSTVFASSLLFLFVVSAFLFAENPFGNVFIICTTLLSYTTPLFTLKNVKKLRIVYITLLYFGVSSTLMISCKWILQIFTPDILIEIATSIMLHCILLVICILFSINSVFYRAKQYIGLIPMKLKGLLLVSVWASDAFAFSFSNYAFQHPRTLTLTFSEISAAAIIILVGIMWPFIIVGNTLNTSYKAALDNMDGQMQSQLKQYELMIKANENTRKFKHDFNNLKIGLTGHLQNNDPQGALRFLEDCEQSIQGETTSYETGNLIADALLSEKQTIAKAGNVQITFNGLVPSSGISPMDICVIFGNILDNALEACEKVPGENVQTIFISSYLNNGFLFLTVSNPVKEDVAIKNNMISTSKRDKENHGIGLASVNNAIGKYDGIMKSSCTDKVFSTEITLDLNDHY